LLFAVTFQYAGAKTWTEMVAKGASESNKIIKSGITAASVAIGV